MGPWDGSSQDFRNNTTTQLFRHNSDLPSHQKLESIIQNKGFTNFDVKRLW